MNKCFIDTREDLDKLPEWSQLWVSSWIEEWGIFWWKEIYQGYLKMTQWYGYMKWGSFVEWVTNIKQVEEGTSTNIIYILNKPELLWNYY